MNKTRGCVACAGLLALVGCSAVGGGVDPKPDPSTATSTSEGGSGGAGGGVVDGGSGAGGDAAPPAGVSGDRLKVQRWVGADGSELVSGLRDSLYGVQCTFAEATDGVTRCLPPSGVIWYLDNACIVPALYWTGCGNPPGYVSRVMPGTCGAGSYEVRPVMSATNQTTIFIGDSTNCVQTTAPTTGAIYQLGSPVAPSEFVAVTLETE